MEKLDYKKKYKYLYNNSSKEVSFVEVPEMYFIMVDGEGDPNSTTFQERVEVLYGLTYTIKFMLKNKELQPRNYQEWVIPPLEGLWWMEGQYFNVNKRDKWKWTIMIMQPDFINDKIFSEAKLILRSKKSINVDLSRLERIKEGSVAQIKHIGSYSEEKWAVDSIFKAIKDNGYQLRGKHQEIYLNDSRKTSLDKLKTIIRHPYLK